MRCFFFIKNELKYTQFRIKTASLFFSNGISSSTFSLWYIYRVLIKKLINLWSVFSHVVSSYAKIAWHKRKFYHVKRVQFPQDFFYTQTWPPIHCFVHKYGRRDVMWKRSIKPVKYMTSQESRKSQFNSTSVWQVPRNLNSISDENKWSLSLKSPTRGVSINYCIVLYCILSSLSYL